MKNSLLIFLLLVAFCALAQKPIAKVDINMEGRSETEVNEDGYTPWFIPRVTSDTIIVSGIQFELQATSPKNHSTMRCSWSKALVQSPYYMKLVNDGVQIDNDSLIANPGQGGELELHISGLPVGVHSIQTYHNSWQDTTKRNFAPFNVYLNDVLIHGNIQRSIQAKTITDATILLTELKVSEANQRMTIRISPNLSFVATEGKESVFNVSLNAFELNTDDASKQARVPVPGDADMHVDADSGFFILQWKPALNNYTKNHQLYFGTDSVAVASAKPADTNIYKGLLPLKQTEYKVDKLYNLNTYYWRVDETDSTGLITKGKTWSFRPRHLAFRGAEGYGRFATGGRGGKVVEVTNLNAEGPGSFHEAVTNDIGPRTIVFAVSGIIELNSRLVLNDQYVTVAGQTAPGKGICIRKAPFGVGSETITRFLRVRLGAGPTFDGMGMAGNNHSIIDHCSISWTIDEAFSSRGGKNLTLQRTLISEALNMANHQNYGSEARHGYAASIGGDVGSFHHNLLAHNNGRNWSLAGGLDGNGYYAGRLDIFNNIVYNWQGRTTDGGAHEVNFVNNYYKKGVASGSQDILTAQLEGLGKGSQSYYFSGNILQSTNGSYLCDGTNNACSRGTQVAASQVVNWEVFVNEPFFPSYAKIETAKDAYKSVLSDVGCTMPMFDDHDKRIVNETLQGTYTYKGSRTKVGGIIDHQDDAGGYEDYPEIHRPSNFDTDHDGLPDWWETLHGSNLNSAKDDFSDSNADLDKDGYTALEDYLEWMSVPHFYLHNGVSDTISLSRFTLGYINPAYSCENSGLFNLNIDGSNAIITPKSNANGISYLNMKATDNEGSEIIRVIGICIGVERPESEGFENPLGLAEHENKLSCSVYPSVFDKQINIEIYNDKGGKITLLLCDLTGKQLLTTSFVTQAGNNTFQFECPSEMSKQIYLLRLLNAKSGEVYKTMRVIKN